ncbi:MAG: hypothetical protein QOH12_1425 [Solirubrobacteraceae bacterium]|jgi:hypothetical protein|nr:hypothetical protein [Solirubrobacteraceae bacterium]
MRRVLPGLGLLLLLGTVAATVGWSAVPAPAGASACSKLPVTISLPSNFAAAYPSKVPLHVATRGGAITNVRAQIYTFSGDQIAAGQRARLTGSATISLKLAFGALQVGSYTVVVTGTLAARPGCGLEKMAKVEIFKPCLTTLPLTFVDPPGGAAADYAGYLSVPLKSDGPLIRELEGAVYAADGTLFGDGTLTALYGQATLSLKLHSPLVTGVYTVVVAGLIPQPQACGPKTVQVVLVFS